MSNPRPLTPEQIAALPDVPEGARLYDSNGNKLTLSFDSILDRFRATYDDGSEGLWERDELATLRILLPERSEEKVVASKEWFLSKAHLEEGMEIGAGRPDSAELANLRAEVERLRKVIKYAVDDIALCEPEYAVILSGSTIAALKTALQP